jgi:preprotein translocase subunit YajC
MLYALAVLLAFADENVKEADKDGGGAFGRGFFDNPLLLFLLLGAMFVFIVLLPQQRRERKQREALLTNLKKNDEVITTAGIIGVVTHIKETGDEVTLKIDDNAKIRVLKSTIARILTKDGKEGA